MSARTGYANISASGTDLQTNIKTADFNKAMQDSQIADQLAKSLSTSAIGENMGTVKWHDVNNVQDLMDRINQTSGVSDPNAAIQQGFQMMKSNTNEAQEQIDKMMQKNLIANINDYTDEISDKMYEFEDKFGEIGDKLGIE